MTESIRIAGCPDDPDETPKATVDIDFDQRDRLPRRLRTFLDTVTFELYKPTGFGLWGLKLCQELL
jgi:hypothetical protein